MDRDAFLARVGQAAMTAILPESPAVPERLPEVEVEDLVTLFRERAQAVDAVVHGPVARHGAPVVVTGIAAGHGCKTFMAWDELPSPGVASALTAEGLQRISAGTVFAALPFAVGDVVDERTIRAATRSLFATGNFDDIRIGQDGNVLVVFVTERPSISEINIEGNKAIETEALLEGLKGAGLAVGQYRLNLQI